MRFKHYGWWKRKLLIEGEAGGGSGGGGGAGGDDGKGGGAGGDDGGGAGAGGKGAGGDDGKGGKSKEAPAVDAAELERLRAIEARHKEITEHVDYDETTKEVKLKKKVDDEPILPVKTGLTAEEQAKEDAAREAADRAVAVTEANQKMEAAIIDQFKNDPMFGINMTKARSLMEPIPASKRTKGMWERAYSMARGDVNTQVKFEEHIRKDERAKVLKELGAQNGANMDTGGGEGSGDGEKNNDVSKIVLTPRQLAAAKKAIAAGMVKDINQYKENMVFLELASNQED